MPPLACRANRFLLHLEQRADLLAEMGARVILEQTLGAETAEKAGDYIFLGAFTPGLANKTLTAQPKHRVQPP